MDVTRLSVCFCAVLLGLGLAAPTLTIQPQAGNFTWLVKMFSPEDLEPATYSILGIIGKLYEEGDSFLTIVLFLFSVAFPTGKLCLYWVASDPGDSSPRIEILLRWTHRAGKFSMAEVFALALMVLVVKALPGGSTASVEWGAYVFVASVLGAILVSFRLYDASNESPLTELPKNPRKDDSD